MPNIMIEDAIKISAADKFWEIRAKAIQAYANLEQALASLFAALGAVAPDVGAIIFFKIASSDARNKIIEALFRKKFDDAFNLFRNSLFYQLRPIDQDRNSIVHWNAACQTGHDGTATTAKVVLTPAAILAGKKPPIMTTEDLEAFDAKAIFYGRLINMFTLMACNVSQHPIPEHERKQWLEIFSRPIIYPPPEDHPLFPKTGALDGHIQAFLV
jgi:hypothetical protein